MNNNAVNPPPPGGIGEQPSGPPLIACLECDLLQREIALPEGGKACCPRCGAELYRNTPDSIDRTLAFTLGAAVLFALANVFPIVGLDIQGHRNATTLIGAVHSLYQQDWDVVASLVFVTAILAPAMQIAALTYMLVPLRWGHQPRGLALVFRMLQAVRPWGMVEVFMLGVLVSLVKLAGFAHVIPGVALWSTGLLMFMLAAASGSFNPRDVWARRPKVAR